MKCPTLPPFEDRTTWQTARIPETHDFLLHSPTPQHFDEVHAVNTPSGSDTGKWEKIATPQKKPPKFACGDAGSIGFHSGQQHHEASDNTNLKVRNPWIVKEEISYVPQGSCGDGGPTCYW